MIKVSLRLEALNAGMVAVARDTILLRQLLMEGR
jgi:hypothetical protein